MKKQMIAASMAAALTFNMVQFALAADAANGLSREQLAAEYAKGQIDEKTLTELMQSRDSVVKLITQLNGIQNSNIKDPILRYSTQAQALAIAASAYAANSGLKELHDPRVVLGLTVLTISLNKFIKYYSSGSRVDANSLSALVSETSNEMLAANPNNQDLIALSNLVRDYSTNLITNQNEYAETIKSVTGVSSDGVALLTAAALAINMFAPKLAAQGKVILKEGEEVLKDSQTIWAKISPVLADIQKTKQVSGKAAHGTSGSSGILDVVAMIAGMNNQKSLSLINATQGNLTKTLAELNGKIGRAQGLK